MDSPYLYRRHSPRHTSLSPSAFKSPQYRYYQQPKVTFDSVRTSLQTHVAALETEIRTYVTQVETRIGELKAQGIKEISPVKERPKSRLQPILTPTNVRSSSDNHKSKGLPLNPRRHKAHTQHPRQDSFSALLQSNGFQEDWTKVDSIVNRLKADRSVLPAPCLGDLLEQVKTKHELQEEYKRAIWPSYAGSSPLAVYSQACDELKVPPLPSIAKVTGNKLILNRYQLQTALCKALAKALPTLTHLQSLYLDSNAISDSGGAALLSGLAHTQIQLFYYTRNEIGLKFVDKMESLSASDLKEISFNGCKVINSALKGLITSVLRINDLEKLYLSDIGLTETSILSLTSALKRSKLTHLDLSCNTIPLPGTKHFLAYLRRDKKLRYLDYSHNSLNSPDNEVAYMVGGILRAHCSLIHVNLSCTQIGEEGVRMVVQGLKRSRTVVALHLTGNNIDERGKEAVNRILEGRREDKLLSDSANIRPVPIITSLPAVIPRRSSDFPANLKLRDSFGHKFIAHRDSLVNIFHSDSKCDFPSYILSRVLGHPEVSNSDMWTYSQHCWVCERWSIFTFHTETTQLKPIESVDVLTNRMGNDGNLTLKGSFNDYFELNLTSLIADEYAISLLLPPGEHKFWFIHNQSDLCVSSNYRTQEELKIKLNRVKVPIRTVDVDLMLAVREEKVRVFDKNKSVFKAFVEDTEALMDLMFGNDMKHSKICRIVKDAGEFAAVTQLLRERFSEIKEIFDNTAASSNYPTISWLDFTDFCNICQLIDKKYLNTAAIDRLFIAVNVELEELDENPNRELCRFEFFEIIVRLALCKYQDTGLSPVKMVEKILNEHILKHGAGSNAIAFRKEKLYQVEVNDVLEVNIFSLQTLFSSHKEPRSKHITIKGVRSLLFKSSIPYNDRDLLRDFAFSKMSVLDENNANGAHEKMLFVEFLEFIGRFSETVVKDEVPLWMKIEQVLDLVFPPHGLKRKSTSELVREDED